jgi:hypothetical protein
MRQTAAVPTLGHVLRLYLTHQTPTKGIEQQREDIRRAQLWLRVLGGGTVKVSEEQGVRTVAVTGGARDLRTLGAAEWEMFKAKRLTGEIGATRRAGVRGRRRRGPPAAADRSARAPSTRTSSS